ncbi:MAG: TetR/AcrR family transcriptional regulator [Acidimicrobiales bacterium]
MEARWGAPSAGDAGEEDDQASESVPERRARRPSGALRSTRPALSPNRERLIDATLRCLARHGTVKTTVDDIAREASVSRATVYRTFPGGRDELLAALVDTEVARLFTAVGLRLGTAENLADALVEGMVEASVRITGHPALRYLVEHEPETILGHLAFDEFDHLLDSASRFAAPFLSRWMTPHEAERVAEWATRIVFSYAAPSESLGLTDRQRTRRLVEQFMLPGVGALHSAGSVPISITPFDGASTPGADQGATGMPRGGPTLDRSSGIDGPVVDTAQERALHNTNRGAS